MKFDYPRDWEDYKIIERDRKKYRPQKVFKIQKTLEYSVTTLGPSIG